jgi:hypothetical protein
MNKRYRQSHRVAKCVAVAFFATVGFVACNDDEGDGSANVDTQCPDTPPEFAPKEPQLCDYQGQPSPDVAKGPACTMLTVVMRAATQRTSASAPTDSGAASIPTTATTTTKPAAPVTLAAMVA